MSVEAQAPPNGGVESPVSPIAKTTSAAASPRYAFLDSPNSPTSTTTHKLPPSRGWLSSVRRPKTSPGPRSASAFRKQLLAHDDDARRDSALASSLSSGDAKAPSTPLNDDRCSPNNSLRRTPSLPAITVQDDSRNSVQTCRDSIQADTDLTLTTIDTIIPTGGFDDLTSPNQVTFSKRGSILLGGKRANATGSSGRGMGNHLTRLAEGASSKGVSKALPAPPAPALQITPPRQREEKEPEDKGKEKEKEHEKQKEEDPNASVPRLSTPHLSPAPRTASGYTPRRRAASTRILSTDEAMLSKKVRSMYKHGNESAANWDGDEEGSNVQNELPDSSIAGSPNASSLLTTVDDAISMRSSRRESVIQKEPTEVAGGAEDWTDIEGGEVDRYGFIIDKKVSQEPTDEQGLEGPDVPRMHRVTTLLQMASEEPRKRSLARSVSRARSTRSVVPKPGSLLRHRSQRSRTQASIFSNRTGITRRPTQKPFRQATNRLPHNRDRRLLDEASDMLRHPFGLDDNAEKADTERLAQVLRQKEMEREEKWRKMAKVVASGAKAGGMMFEFDTKDPKVVSRTWKGIPDRWRATAWYAFLAASAKADPNSPSDEELIASFYELQEESSADDMQIDVDVPRTINRHIMFRRRYRGGQRLLFRVLHAMSLYLPETGYVQGMAPLTATLLCYYEEDKAFVMLVRLWQHRGLERLYEKGFKGLTEALDDFERNWLRGGEVAKKFVSPVRPTRTVSLANAL